MPKRILFVFTSADKTLTGKQTVRTPDMTSTPHSLMSTPAGVVPPRGLSPILQYARYAHPPHLRRHPLTRPACALPVLAPKYDIDFAAPKGANPPVDEGSLVSFAADKGFLDDPVVQQKLAAAKPLSEVSAADYDAIFYPGGHGPVLDLASDPVNAKLASEVSFSWDPVLGVYVCVAARAGCWVGDGKGSNPGG